MNTVYIESTIPSYLTARPTDNIIAAARQVQGQEWWEKEKQKYELYTSDVVLVECNSGDPVAASKRMEILKGIPLLEITDESINLAEQIFQSLGLPERARDDALHIAIASIHGVDYLLSWNFRHIVFAAFWIAFHPCRAMLGHHRTWRYSVDANAMMRPLVREMARNPAHRGFGDSVRRNILRADSSKGRSDVDDTAATTGVD